MLDDYYLVTTRNVHHSITREVLCRDLPTAFTVAGGMRKRVHGWCRDYTMPFPTTAITITRLVGPARQGRAVACLTFPGAPKLDEAIAAAEAARWRYILPGEAHKGTASPIPPAGEPELALPRFHAKVA